MFDTFRSVVAWCALVVVAAAGDGAPTARVTPDGAEVLPFDGRRLAVQSVRTAHDVQAALAEVVEVAALEPMVVAGWWLVDVRGDGVTADAQRARLEALAAHDAIDAASPVFSDRHGGPLVATPHVLVAFDEGRSASDEVALLEAVGLVVERERFGDRPGAYRARLAEASPVGFDALAAANALALRNDVAWADVDWIFTGRSTLMPNDPEFTDQWALRNVGQFSGVAGVDVGATLAWDVTTGDPSIVTLVLDVGVQQDHPDLNLVPGADVTTDGPGDGGPVNACDDHGTPVAGCIAAARDNGLGGTGVAPDTRVASVRAFISNPTCDGTWTSQASWTVDALVFGQSIGARVSNNSNDYGFNSPAIDAQYLAARAGGMVHFGSIGNAGAGFATYPASLGVVNAVGAIRSDGALAAFSNFGPDVVLVAPGVIVLSTDRQAPEGFVPGDDYAFVDGTSFAAPLAAGVAALMLSVDPALTPAAIEAALTATATDLGAPGVDMLFGAGLVSAVGALEPLAGPFGTWVDEGHALAGTGGAPSLDGTGLLLGDTPLTLTLDGTAPGLLANLVVGFTQLDAPFKGGVLVPKPDVLFGGFPTSAAPLVVSGDWPAAVPAGIDVSYQYWIADPGGPVGFAASNALTSTTP